MGMRELAGKCISLTYRDESAVWAVPMGEDKARLLRNSR